jgi:uncharacterized membrane protein YeaQ/YmgE (transglycosylase-associated protein family)
MEQTVSTLTGTLLGILLIGVVGLVIGLIARFLVPGPDPANALLTSALGIGGSLLGGVVGNLVGAQVFGQLVLAILGAVVLVLALRLIRSRPAA